MPNRILKESICTSDNLDQLSAFQETMFYRLIVSCDDYGRMDARPKILASRLFPLKDIRANQIEDGLRALTSAELVILYEVDGKPFLQMKTWDCHQQVRARKSKFPGPDEGVISSDINCNQMISSDCKCSRNPIQSESNPNPIRESESEYSPEPANGSGPVAARLPLVGGAEFLVYEGQVAEWSKLYPAVNVQQELNAMTGWLDANPTRRKTRNGIKRFINGWLAREQDSGKVKTAPVRPQKGPAVCETVETDQGYAMPTDMGDLDWLLGELAKEDGHAG